jgi:hypothetical protein
MDRLETLLRLSDWQGRKYRRFDLQFPVRVKVYAAGATTEIEGVSKNVSLGGLLVRSALPISEHTLVKFVLSVHGEHAVRPIHLAGEGEVIRVENAEDEAGYALAVQCSAPVTLLEEFLPKSTSAPETETRKRPRKEKK